MQIARKGAQHKGAVAPVPAESQLLGMQVGARRRGPR